MYLFLKHYEGNLVEINLISLVLEIFSKTFFEASGKLRFLGRGLSSMSNRRVLSLGYDLTE
tara:strand:+ start:730 stop:912 length:183 start_codon:yes stop_codon:yes gene_type:complete